MYIVYVLTNKIIILQNTIEQLQKALTSARVTINDKENELDRLQEESQAMVNQLSEQLEAARNNVIFLSVSFQSEFRPPSFRRRLAKLLLSKKTA